MDEAGVPGENKTGHALNCLRSSAAVNLHLGISHILKRYLEKWN